MRDTNIATQLRRLAVEHRPVACLGCGQEHSCSIHGCAVIQAAAQRLTPTIWVRAHGHPLHRACGVCGYQCRTEDIQRMHITHCPGCGRPITEEDKKYE